ncbi:hypothetical protein SAMN04487910_0388 [Aquimarina amphilecti]|uniref:Uncharacterized protein n=1 Tax=Aquimarina amphilecti TaxID=1038014 RepID=A0A1H7GIM3_AQUAM|nr:hypothetical protein [Aquimarina amphilecti]SEK37968.1 hypothetical protein SAMN04487910_0388 [Aquimarina amphilecti]
MPIITISEHLEHYQTLKSQFVSPHTNMEVMMEVRLHKKIINTGLVQNIQKKPVIAFYTTPERTEIPKKEWTQQMKKTAVEYAKEYPVIDAGKTYSTFGKVIFSTTIIGIIGAFALVFYLFVFSNPQVKMNIEEFVSLPSQGDKFYGFINQSLDEKKKPFLAHGWIKVIAVNPVDSTCTYVTSTGIGELTFDTLESDHSSFANKEIQGKFKADKKAQKITLISSDKRWRFESQVISNKTKNYKITAE